VGFVLGRLDWLRLLSLGWGSLSSVDINCVRSALLDKGCETLYRSITRECDGIALLSGKEQLDGWESLDIIRNIIGSGVNLGDGNLVAEWLEKLSQLVVLGRQGLAVSAPWGVELNKNILGIVKNNLLVVVGNNHGNGTVLLLWDRLRLDAWLDLARVELLNEFANLLGSNGLAVLVGEFLVLDGVLDGKGGPFANLEVQVSSMLTKSLGVNGCEVDLAMVLLGEGLEVLGEALALLLGLGEDVGERNTSLDTC
jgi:hypothetical protein